MLSEERPLADKLEAVTMMGLRENIGFIIAQVRLGKTYVLTKQGKPVAILSKPPGDLVVYIDGQGNQSLQPSRSPQ